METCYLATTAVVRFIWKTCLSKFVRLFSRANKARKTRTRENGIREQKCWHPLFSEAFLIYGFFMT